MVGSWQFDGEMDGRNGALGTSSGFIKRVLMMGKPAYNKGKGRAYRWICEHIYYDGDACLIFPFSRDSRGYGQVGLNGKVLRAHRVMCELALGTPPSDDYHAAHTCGHGDLGCVNPNHLKWKTGSENQFDRRKHGTHGGGQGRGVRKLSPRAVELIKQARGRITQKDLAETFGASDATIRAVQSGRLYKS